MRDPDECYTCGGLADCSMTTTTAACRQCKRRIITAKRYEYYCSTCDRAWYSTDYSNDAVTLDDGTTYCTACITVRSVWCPVCERSVAGSAYLAAVFLRSPAAYHAACLVTHYRHQHIRSHDRACASSRYRNAIPGYDYEQYKVTVNNRAKRQILRALVKRQREGTAPDGIDAMKLMRGFRRLKENDGKTRELIAATLKKVGALVANEVSRA